MKGTETVNMLRRQFLASSPFLLLGAGSLEALPLPQTAPRGADLREELTAAELESVNRSVMARDMDNFWNKGYSCAETGFVVALRFLKRPEDLVWTAGGFGGGMGRQDLCGFLTAGIMALGLYAGALKIERKAAKELCGRNVNEYWNWWASTAPLHCSNIRQGHKGFNVCHRLGKLAAAKIETLFSGD